jgi:dTDP-4-amino-4,6-dideoxygalactose transaminase
MFSQYHAGNRRPLPRTDELAARVLTLPLYGRMTDEQVETVIEEFKAALSTGG